MTLDLSRTAGRTDACEPGLTSPWEQPALGSAVSSFVPPFEVGEPRSEWLHAISHLHPKYGGVSAVVPQLSAAIANTGRYSIRLAGFCAPDEEYVPAPADQVCVSHLPLGRRAWNARPAAAQDLTEWVDRCAGIHIHGLWQHSTALTAKLARKAGTPYVISAHGMLEPWALANKRWKKRIYLALVERANLQAATCLHALTRAEADDYRRLGLKNPIAVIPNGVHVPFERSSEPFLSQFPALTGKRLVLFLGRIHFKKGVDILCQAWSRVAAQFPDAHLVLAGPDCEGTRAGVEKMIEDLHLSQRVTFTGMLTGESKWSALAASEFFVLPSYSEGLSVSILEAMGMGKPVLITENCNLPEVAAHRCGTVIPATAAELATALTAMLQLSAKARLEMGHRGEQLVRTRYSWEAIGRQFGSLYQWIERGAHTSDAAELELVDMDFVGRSQ